MHATIDSTSLVSRKKLSKGKRHLQAFSLSLLLPDTAGSFAEVFRQCCEISRFARPFASRNPAPDQNTPTKNSQLRGLFQVNRLSEYRIQPMRFDCVLKIGHLLETI